MIPNEPFVPIMERPWGYSDTERLEAYRICQQRGHQPSNVTLTVDPPLSVCRFCGTQYRYEEQLIEVNPPREESSDVPKLTPEPSFGTSMTQESSDGRIV